MERSGMELWAQMQGSKDLGSGRHPHMAILRSVADIDAVTSTIPPAEIIASYHRLSNYLQAGFYSNTARQCYDRDAEETF